MTQNITKENGTKLIQLKPEYDINGDAYVNIDTELKPFLEELVVNVTSSAADSVRSGRCLDFEGCPIWLRSDFALEPNLSIIGNVSNTTNILILQGENDTQTLIQQAFLLDQKLTQLKHPDHTLITYPNLGNAFYPSSQWITSIGPIKEYVLSEMFEWLSNPIRSNTVH